MSAARAQLHVRRLLVLAERMRDLLADGDFDAAVELQGEYDASFRELEPVLGKLDRITGELSADLYRLQHLHDGVQRTIEGLRDEAGKSIAELRKVRRIGGYAPLGTGPGGGAKAPRYLDHSA